MSIEIIKQISGIILFFLPGVLLSYLIFPKTNVIKRAVYSIVLAPCIVVIAGIVLYSLNLLTAINTILVLIFLIISFLLIIFNFDKEHQTT
ncbi:MAG: hypothetical protein Q8N63_08525, partial [Nanoarchaeota archaeon]|nr:hypothetical protein [Nanoarchaeota archaeon]